MSIQAPHIHIYAILVSLKSIVFQVHSKFKSFAKSFCAYLEIKKMKREYRFVLILLLTLCVTPSLQGNYIITSNVMSKVCHLG